MTSRSWWNDQPSDQELMAGIAAGDEGALSLLFQRYRGEVFALLLRILGDHAEAEDVLVEIFWETWEKSARFNPQRSDARTYLMMLTRSRAIDRVRKQRRANEVLDASSAQIEREAAEKLERTAPLSSAVAAEQRLLVAEALASLETSERQALELAFFGGLTHREIAERLETPLGTVKTRIRQGLLKLRDKLRVLDEMSEASL